MQTGVLAFGEQLDYHAWAFSCAALVDPPTGRMTFWYGAADTVTCLAFAKFDELVHFIQNNSL